MNDGAAAMSAAAAEPAAAAEISKRAPAAKKVGVLALQGDYAAHIAVLRSLGAQTFEVRSRADLDLIDALVIPGGESTVMGTLLRRFGFLDALKAKIEAGMPAFGTCAGLILLAKSIEGSEQPRVGLLDVKVRRNAYGTQIDSFRTLLETSLPGLSRIEGVFIRAPEIVATGPGVEVLASYKDRPVLVRQGSLLGAAFHPELVAGGASLYAWFLGFSLNPRETR